MTLAPVAALAAAFVAAAVPTRPVGPPPVSPPVAKQPVPPVAASPESSGPTLAPLVEQVSPSVVGVTTKRQLDTMGEGNAELWRRFFGGERGRMPPMPSPDIQRGLGSGVIVDAKGIVVTNFHVVEGASEVLVRTFDGAEHEAEVVGTDPDTDLAVLRLKNVKAPLVAAQLGSSDQLRVGDFVVAIGNPFGLELTVTTGIVSAKSRVIGAGPYDEFLQTDAPINPGNSGGPLFDLRGRVVGINAAIVATGQGIGFAVPIDLVKALLPQLLEAGHVSRGLLGVAAQDLTPELARALKLGLKEGALVSSVESGGPADKAGLDEGDVIVKVNGRPIKTAAELSRTIALLAPGTQARLTVQRAGAARELTAKLGERPTTREVSTRAPEKQDESRMGIALHPLTPELAEELGVEQGVVVAEVRPGSRADDAGLQEGDVIVEADRKKVTDPREFVAIAKKHASDEMLLRIARGGRFAYVVVPPSA